MVHAASEVKISINLTRVPSRLVPLFSVTASCLAKKIPSNPGLKRLRENGVQIRKI